MLLLKKGMIFFMLFAVIIDFPRGANEISRTYIYISYQVAFVDKHTKFDPLDFFFPDLS